MLPHLKSFATSGISIFQLNTNFASSVAEAISAAPLEHIFLLQEVKKRDGPRISNRGEIQQAFGSSQRAMTGRSGHSPLHWLALSALLSLWLWLVSIGREVLNKSVRTTCPLCLSIAPQCASNPRQNRYRDHTRCLSWPQTRWWRDAAGLRHYADCEIPAAAGPLQGEPITWDVLTPSGGDTAADDDAAAALVASAASAAATKAHVASGQGKMITASDRASVVYAVEAGTRPAALSPVPSGPVHQRAILR